MSHLAQHFYDYGLLFMDEKTKRRKPCNTETTEFSGQALEPPSSRGKHWNTETLEHWNHRVLGASTETL